MNNLNLITRKKGILNTYVFLFTPLCGTIETKYRYFKGLDMKALVRYKLIYIIKKEGLAQLVEQPFYTRKVMCSNHLSLICENTNN